MSVIPAEIMFSKILANGLVIVVAAGLSLLLVVQWWLQVPITGSIFLFLGGACFYVFTVKQRLALLWAPWLPRWPSSLIASKLSRLSPGRHRMRTIPPPLPT